MRGKGQCTFTVCSNLWDHPRLCGEKLMLSKMPLAASLDHPRLCGEKSRRVEKNKMEVGSPPPMRGKD